MLDLSAVLLGILIPIVFAFIPYAAWHIVSHGSRIKSLEEHKESVNTDIVKQTHNIKAVDNKVDQLAESTANNVETIIKRIEEFRQ